MINYVDEKCCHCNECNKCYSNDDGGLWCRGCEKLSEKEVFENGKR